MRMWAWAVVVMVLAVLCASARAVDYRESENNGAGNNSKSTFERMPPSAVTIQFTTADRILGELSAADTSDYFEIHIQPESSIGIYRYSFITESQDGSPIPRADLVGLLQSAGSKVAGSTATVSSGPRIEVYTNGAASTGYFSMSRSSGGIQRYRYRMECTRIDVLPPTSPAGPGVIDAGTFSFGAIAGENIFIQAGTGRPSGVNYDWWVYDSNFIALPDFGHDENDAVPDTDGIGRMLLPGTYYVAVSDTNFANDKVSPADDLFRDGNILDFPNFTANSTFDFNFRLPIRIRDSVGHVFDGDGYAIKRLPFGVVFFRFQVVNAAQPIPPAGRGVPIPNPVTNNGTGSVTWTVDVTRGTSPLSNTHSVIANLSSLGGPAVAVFTPLNATKFTYTFAIPAGTPPGLYSLPTTVCETSPLSRCSTFALGADVFSPVAPTGACCTNQACSIKTQFECQRTGGVYQGNAVPCSSCSCAAPETPSNDLCSNAALINLNVYTRGDTCNATIDNGLPDCSGVNVVAPGVWYVCRGTGRTMTASLCSGPDMSFDSRLSVFCGGCGSLTCVAGNDNACGPLSQATWCSLTDNQYYILVHGASPSAKGAFDLVVTTGLSCGAPPACTATGACCIDGVCSVRTRFSCNDMGGVYKGDDTTCSNCTCEPIGGPRNDVCLLAQEITVGETTPGDTCTAAIDTGSPQCANQAITAGGVWYTTIGTGTTMTATLCGGASYDSRMSVFCGDCSALTCVGGNDDFPGCNLLSQVSWCAQAGARYFILVHGYSDATGPFAITLTQNGQSCQPSVLCTPTGACCLPNQQVCQISSAIDCVVMGGTYLGDGTTCDVYSDLNEYPSPGPFPVPIPDASGSIPGMASTSYFIASGDIISALRVCVGLTHTFAGDLIVSIQHGDTTARLMNRVAAGSNLGGQYCFSDNATDQMLPTPLIPPGDYLPSDPLSVFSGSSLGGFWTLTVTDNAGADIGTIDSLDIFTLGLTSACGGGSCPPCAADYNQDGGVDGNDASNFFADWEAGVPCSDVNADGGVDGSDVSYFFFVWELGSC